MEESKPRKAPTQSALHLAFGSFSFQISPSAPKQLTGRAYLELIRKSLEGIAAVGQIDIEAHEPLYEDWKWERPDEVPDYNETGFAVPGLQFVEIGFSLHVPQRVQRALGERGLSIPESLGEEFLVRIQDGWQLPNAMVWPIECSSSENASNAVIVVREVLYEEFSRLKNSPVRLECLGPTPAHFTAELIQGSEQQPEDFEETNRRKNGYHRFTFSYRKSLGPAPVVAELFHSAINSELDLHYRVVRARRQQGLAWNDAASETQRVIDTYRETGPLSPIKRVLQGGRINRSLIGLAEIELDQRQELQNLQSEFDSTYEEGGHTLIRNPVEDMFREFRPIPVGPLSKLLELFDARRSTARAVLIAAVASLIGAAVAAAATLIAAG